MFSVHTDKILSSERIFLSSHNFILFQFKNKYQINRVDHSLWCVGSKHADQTHRQSWVTIDFAATSFCASEEMFAYKSRTKVQV